MMLFILHKYVVAKLCVFTAAASGSAVRTAVRPVCDVEHFAVGTAGTILQSPPVVVCGKVIDVFFLKAGFYTVLCAFLITGCIYINCEYGCCKMVSIKSEYIG